MTEQKRIRQDVEDILTEEFIEKNSTHENAPPGKDCFDDCYEITTKEIKKHGKCRDCWTEYIKGLTLHILQALSEQGVVLRVDGELPANIYANERDRKVCHGTQQEMLRRMKLDKFWKIIPLIGVKNEPFK